MAVVVKLTVHLSDPYRDCTGGEFVPAEQRRRMQVREPVRPLVRAMRSCSRSASGLIAGCAGDYRVTIRHIGNTGRRALRHRLGIVDHDAG